MHAALLVLASAAVGVDWGYRPLPAGGIEYIVQLEPQAFDDLAAGGSEIVSHVPPELYDIRQFRLTVGKQKLPRGGRVATPAKLQTAAEGVQVTPASLTGGGNEHVVELDRASIDQMKRAMDLVYEVENVRRYRIRLRQPAATTTRIEQVSGTLAESTPGDVNMPPPAEAAPARSAAPMPTELDSAPPFVPTGVVRDPNPLRGTAPEDAPRGAAAAGAAKPASEGLAEGATPTAPTTISPEPLKIDVAPAADSSPRPLRPMPTGAAAPQTPSKDKPTSTNVANDWPPVSPMNPTVPVGTPKSQAAPKSEPAGRVAEDNPFAAPPNAVPTAGDARLSPEPKAAPETSPVSAPKTALPQSDEPAGSVARQGTPNATEPQSISTEPPTNRSSADPFPPLETNPLRGPQADDPPRNDLRLPPGSAFGVGAAQSSGANPSTAPSSSSSPARSGPGNRPASDTMPPAFGAFPPLSTPSTANPPGEAAKTGDGTQSVPTTLPDHNDAFPSPFGAPAGGASSPGSEPAAKTADGTQSVPATLTGHDDPFPPAFGAPANGANLPVGGPAGAGSLDNASSRVPSANDTSAGTDHFPTSQPPALPRMGFNDDTRPAERAATERAATTAVDRREEPAGPAAAATPAPGDKKPWWALTGALVVLFSSLGGNVYLGWMNWDLRRQYAALLDMFKQQRASKGRASSAVQ